MLTHAAPGWYQNEQDPRGVLRWFDGQEWTASVHGSPTPSVPPGAPAPVPPSVGPRPIAALPSIASTIIVTLFLGLLGLIPTFINTDRARTIGQPTNRYWKAFWWTIAAQIAFWVLIAVIAVVVALLAASDSSSSGIPS